MWTVGIDGSDPRELRPADEHGRVRHQIVVDGGLLYAASHPSGQVGDETWFGRYTFADDTWHEWRLPDGIGYVHTDNDPTGQFLHIETCAPGQHELYQVQPRRGEPVADLSLLRVLNPAVHDVFDRQRHHAHPFLSPDGRQLFFTDVIDGYSQICSIDISDRTQRSSQSVS